ncbi:ATP-dependent RNA helicase dbp6 [Spiromyces aspiralis]|uniref:ATP-dependent RNA helicase dbp6 n=1 Tax=Spiromyces aspiralis TaxID=68401 RepID=A0ACC1HSR8_9FUNG|nr:ATP-dependent RNA helicase dbp6 [Spiromyces aspiralis]
MLSLSTRTVQRCREEGIESAFAVQAAVIPALREAYTLSRLRHYVRDLCVSAPTGSGKTLAYVLPIVEKLSQRTVVRLRALVVVPTRDLVVQVKETFERVSKGTGLRVGAVMGAVSLAKEQQHIVSNQDIELCGGSSNVDILVCTPGRLVDHLNMTQNFTLQHLEFLIQKLLFSATLTRDPTRIASLHLVRPLYISVESPPAPQDAGLSAMETETMAVALDVGSGETKYSMPAGLTEYFQVCNPSIKPMLVLHLLYHLNITSALCFTKSLEAAHRLYQLVGIFDKHYNRGRDDVTTTRRVGHNSGSSDDVTVVAEYSSDLSQQERNSILRQFRNGRIRLLICSDVIARGLDLDCVQAVVNYDAPMHMDKYVHRVGRTARAGRKGTAYTLVEKQEARFFKAMVKKHGHYKRMTQLKVKPSFISDLNEAYKATMQDMHRLYSVLPNE